MADPPRVPDNVSCFAFLLAFGLPDVPRCTERLFWEESLSDLSDQTRKRDREAECSKDAAQGPWAIGMIWRKGNRLFRFDKGAR
jgi:hypothetical protein